MNPNQRKHYIGTIEESLKFLGNQVFAEISQIILEVKTNTKLERRGQTISGEAVGYIVDTNSVNFNIVAEYSCEKDYFTDKKLSKIKKDIGHCFTIAPTCSFIYLLANTTCGPKRYTLLQNLLPRFGKIKNKEIILLDARLISEFIVDEVIEKQDSISLEKLSYQIPSLKLIKSEHTYTNTLPERIPNNIERTHDENSIIELLKNNDIVQLYGISGIGKTYLTIQVVNQILKSDWNAIWISGDNLKTPSDLLSYQIDRYGVPQNVIGLM